MWQHTHACSPACGCKCLTAQLSMLAGAERVVSITGLEDEGCPGAAQDALFCCCMCLSGEAHPASIRLLVPSIQVSYSPRHWSGQQLSAYAPTALRSGQAGTRRHLCSAQRATHVQVIAQGTDPSA